jgi:hypothetical protein
MRRKGAFSRGSCCAIGHVRNERGLRAHARHTYMSVFGKVWSNYALSPCRLWPAVHNFSQIDLPAPASTVGKKSCWHGKGAEQNSSQMALANTDPADPPCTERPLSEIGSVLPPFDSAEACLPILAWHIEIGRRCNERYTNTELNHLRRNARLDGSLQPPSFSSKYICCARARSLLVASSRCFFSILYRL